MKSFKELRECLFEQTVPRFSSAKEARAWAERSGAKKLNRSVQDSLTRRAVVYLTPSTAIRISNTKDPAYQAWIHYVMKRPDPHFPKIIHHQDIAPGITFTILRRYEKLDQRTDVGQILTRFTAKMNRDPNRQLAWLTKNQPGLRAAMRDVARWAKKSGFKLDVGNINNYMQDGQTIILADPVA